MVACANIGSSLPLCKAINTPFACKFLVVECPSLLKLEAVAIATARKFPSVEFLTRCPYYSPAGIQQLRSTSKVIFVGTLPSENSPSRDIIYFSDV